MAYSGWAQTMRQCTAARRDGEPCRQYAMWGDPRQVCSAHGGKTRGPDLCWAQRYDRDGRAHYVPCTCAAYAWPHRPGGGLCCWPDPPHVVSTIPSGTRHFGTRWRRRRAH